jgi:methyl-accepting chemotaxis protein
MDQNLGQSSSAIEEIAANIRSVSSRAQENDAAGESLAQVMDRGAASVRELQQTIAQNLTSSQRIQDMIQVIMQISAQTNLLAMNAAIEAAHAGNAGRGFAVVAEEIRKLADQSATSAKEIQGVVKQISIGFGALSASSQTTGTVFSKLRSEADVVRRGSREIAEAMAEQQLANDAVLKTTLDLTRQSGEVKSAILSQLEKTEALFAGIEAITGLSLQVAEATHEESVALKETADASEKLQNLAQDLNHIVAKVDTAFKDFKTS